VRITRIAGQTDVPLPCGYTSHSLPCYDSSADVRRSPIILLNFPNFEAPLMHWTTHEDIVSKPVKYWETAARTEEAHKHKSLYNVCPRKLTQLVTCNEVPRFESRPRTQNIFSEIVRGLQSSTQRKLWYNYVTCHEISFQIPTLPTTSYCVTDSWLLYKLQEQICCTSLDAESRRTRCQLWRRATCTPRGKLLQLPLRFPRCLSAPACGRPACQRCHDMKFPGNPTTRTKTVKFLWYTL
jgi:hypothetical protein